MVANAFNIKPSLFSGNISTTIHETLKKQLLDSPYQLLTPNVISIDGNTKYSSLTGASYTGGVIQFSADSQTLISTNNLDSGEFLPQGVAVGSMDFSVFWSRASSIPTSFTFTGATAATTNTSAVVTVTIPSHGLTTSKKVYIQTSTAIGGISSTNLSTNSVTITVVDANTFTYTAGASATSTASGSLDFVVSGFVYLASRDGGTNYYPVGMSRVGTTETFSGSMQWGQSATTEPSSSYTTFATVGGGATSSVRINATQTLVGSSFTVPANTSWYVLDVKLTVANNLVGTPTGNLVASIYASSGGAPTGTPIAQSLPLAVSGITVSVLSTFTFPATVLSGGASGTTYWIGASGDAAYQAGVAAGNTLAMASAATQTGTNAGIYTYNGSAVWTVQSFTQTMVCSIKGFAQDLRVKMFSASGTTLAYPTALDGYGVFYNLQNSGIVGAAKKTQRFVFNSVTDNLNSFTINTFTADPDLLSCYWVEGGQVFKAPSFTLQGNTAVFPTSTFNQGGVSQTITLIFDQNTGGAFDTSDLNANLLAANHLGSTSGALDKSASGRGILIRNSAGVLRELALDANDNIIILSTP